MLRQGYILSRHEVGGVCYRSSLDCLIFTCLVNVGLRRIFSALQSSPTYDTLPTSHPSSLGISVVALTTLIVV